MRPRESARATCSSSLIQVVEYTAAHMAICPPRVHATRALHTSEDPTCHVLYASSSAPQHGRNPATVALSVPRACRRCVITRRQ